MTQSDLEAFLRRSMVRAFPVDGLESHAELAVDTTHPFFFDHPQDHVPGLLLLSAMSDLAWHGMSRGEQAHAQALHHAHLKARFSKWCLFAPEVHLHARRHAAQPNRLDVQARQDGMLRCEAVVQFDKVRASLPPAAEVRCVPPCEQRQVNKHDAANVMIGTPQESEGRLLTQVIAPSPRHALAGPDVEAFGTLYLLEAFMQTQRYINKQLEQGLGHRMRDTLCEVSIDLHRQVGITEPVDMARAVPGGAASNGLRRQEAQLQVGREVVGQCAIVTLTAV